MRFRFGGGLATVALVFCSFHVMGEDMAQVKTVSEIARSTKRAPGAPKYSDVCFSPRWKRPRNADDPHETMRDAKAFHATRFDWVYSTDPVWIAECRRIGYWFTGTLNTIFPDAPGVSTREKGRILDKDGNRVAAPWMRDWPNPGYWGCVNSPAYRESFLTHAKLLIDGGVDAIQMDDPDINVAAVGWGGCFCEHCRQKAQEQGRNLNQRADMLALQTESVKEFYAFVRKEIDQYAKRRVPWSSNNYDGRTGFPYDLFDFGIAELPHQSATPDKIYGKYATGARNGWQQIFTFVSDNIPLSRRVIAMAYACGGHIIVPYDVYFGNKPRLFFNPEDCADLYGFVRANAALLDGYEDATVVGIGLKDTRWPEGVPVRMGEQDVFVAVRACPGKPDSPVVIHLVDWRDAPEPFVLSLRTEAFFGDRLIRAALHVPPAYDRTAHAEAAERGDHSALTKAFDAKTTVNGCLTELSVPALSPWAIVVLQPKEP